MSNTACRDNLATRSAIENDGVISTSEATFNPSAPEKTKALYMENRVKKIPINHVKSLFKIKLKNNPRLLCGDPIINELISH